MNWSVFWKEGSCDDSHIFCKCEVCYANASATSIFLNFFRSFSEFQKCFSSFCSQKASVRKLLIEYPHLSLLLQQTIWPEFEWSLNEGSQINGYRKLPIKPSVTILYWNKKLSDKNEQLQWIWNILEWDLD